jgi:alpha-ketoglutarate-dependent taurine dioxygenase
MTYVSIQVEKLTPHAGAEIRGVDLSQPLDEPTFKEVHAALIDNGVIFFRDQHLTPAQQKAFGRLFGDAQGSAGAPRDSRHPRRRELQVRGGRELALGCLL